MLILTARIGQVVEIGEGGLVAIKLMEKSGQRVKMAIATTLSPVRIVDGIASSRFSSGISGETRYLPPRNMAAVG